MRKTGTLILALFLLLCIPWLWSYLAPIRFHVLDRDHFWALDHGSLYQRRHDVALVYLDIALIQLSLACLAILFFRASARRAAPGFPMDSHCPSPATLKKVI
jgi:hypothetical protein